MHPIAKRSEVALGSLLALGVTALGCSSDRSGGGSAARAEDGGTTQSGGNASGDAGGPDGGREAGAPGAADPYNADCSTANWAGVDSACWECLCDACPAEVNACDEGCVSILECTFEEGCLVNDGAELGCETQCVVEACLDTPERQGSAQGILGLDACIIGAADAEAGAFRACEDVCAIPYPGDVCTRYPAM